MNKIIRFILVTLAIPIVSFGASFNQYQITLKEGGKTEISGDYRDLYVKDINQNEVVFYLESEMFSLKPIEFIERAGITISVLSVNYELLEATFSISAPIKPSPSPIVQTITAEHAANKIINHGYILVDAYIKKMSAPACTFPDGSFKFWFNNGGFSDLSPTCISGKIWRLFGLLKPNSDSAMIFLDGPIFGEPGTKNIEAIKDATNILKLSLEENEMIVKIVNKEERTETFYNLSRGDEFQSFIDLMYTTIKTGPIFIQRKAFEINPGASLKVKSIQGSGASFEGAGIPTGTAAVQADIDIDGKKNRIEIQTGSFANALIFNGQSTPASFNQELEIKDSKIYLRTTAGLKEIVISPELAIQKIGGVTNVNSVILKETNGQATYVVDGIKKGKFLFIKPIEVKYSSVVNAENGLVITKQKPWWSFLVF